MIENVPDGYLARQENAGAFAGETDRRCNGGAIINCIVPKTGDKADVLVPAGCIPLGLAAISAVMYPGRRKKTQHK